MGSVINALASSFRIALSIAAFAAFAHTATAIERPSDSGVDTVQEDHRVLALEQVPANVMNTAKQAAPDVFFTSAESALKDDFVVYRISGRLFTEVWHVHVREDGRLLRTESDNQDD